MMKTCFTIAVDMDDVIENLLEAWLNWLNTTYKTSVRLNDVDDWELEKFYPALTKEQIYEPLSKEEFWTTVKPKQDAITYLKKLRTEECQDIYIVTNAKYDTVKFRMEHIIKKYFPFIEEDRVIICSKKQLIKCDIMIDDNIDNLTYANYWKFLFNAPHNQKLNLSHYDDAKIKRFNNWKQIYETIKQMDWFYQATKTQVVDY